MLKSVAVAVTIILMVSGVGLLLQTQESPGPSSPDALHTDNVLTAVNASMIPGLNGAEPGTPYNGTMSVIIVFSFSNASFLGGYLANLSNPASPLYHKYMSYQQFDNEFGRSASFYDNAVKYFRSIGGFRVLTYSDHLSIELTGSSESISSAFHTNLTTYGHGSNSFYTITASPLLPSWIASHVRGVVGLSNFSKPTLTLGASSVSAGLPATSLNKYLNYPIPISYSSIQFIWGSDLQRAYNEESLLNATLPVNQSIATILWSGKNSAGTPVGPFYPTDIYTYYNDTLPSWQKKPVIHGVPLGGAPSPGISATHDVSQAAFENTLDLEMAGSVAPGANIYNVYTSSDSYTGLDQCFAYIVNGTDPALSRVSVISNSWYSGSYSDPAWNAALVKAQMHGVTVLAASGDSGDNSTSQKYAGSSASFPGTSAYNTYGMTSVGGASVKLNTVQSPGSFLKIANQTVWYMPNAASAGNTTVGTQGGIDTNISEPVWQLNSVANNVLNGKGRGVPDIGAIANNTLIYITINGTSYYDSPAFYYAWGTSIACPVEAGIMAEINAYLEAHGLAGLGFADPLMYLLGNLQYGSAHGDIRSANASFLLPYYDVLYGRNSQYTELPGYSLVTGLGSINAFNMASDILYNFTGIHLYTVNFTIVLSNVQKITGIYLNNELLSWNTSQFSLFLANGTYSYNITLINGTRNTYSTGSFNINGSSKSVTIHLTNETVIVPPPSIITMNRTLLLTALVLIVIIAVLISVAMRRRK